jgi:hypothetical protein
MRFYRLNRLFLAALMIGFGFASVAYGVFPGKVTAQFADWDRLLGGNAGGYPEPQCRIWTSLAAANVATLSLMSFLLWRDLRKNFSVYWPLLFMKATSALQFAAWYLAMPGARSLLVAAAADLATAVAVWYIPRRALAELRAADSA